MVEDFALRNNHYSLRNDKEFLQPKVKTISYEMETMSVRGPQLWQTLPAYFKNPGTSVHKAACGHCKQLFGSLQACILVEQCHL